MKQDDEYLNQILDKDMDIEKTYYEFLLNNLKYTTKYETLEQCIDTSDKLIRENLKKLYQISCSDEKEEVSELVKNYTEKNIEKMLNFFDKDDKKTLSNMIKMDNINKTKKNIKLITKMCKLGLCFKIKNNEDAEFYIPQEIKEIVNKTVKNIDKETHIKKIRNIINMCGVIKDDELYKIYRENYDININYKDFNFYVNGLEIIFGNFYKNKNCYVYYLITKDKAEKFLEIQKENECNSFDMNDRSVIDLYNMGEHPISPIGMELLEYVKSFEPDIEENMPLQITRMIREQLQFDANKILKEVHEYIPILSNSNKTLIMEYIIRMYHDTRLYKYRGFKPFEIGAYLTDEEIDKIEDNLEIKFKDRDFLRLADIYPDYLSEKYGKVEEDGTISYTKTIYFKQYNINKSKKFVTYLAQKTQADLENLCEVYCMKNKIERLSNRKELLIEYIEENKEEILKHNFATLEESEFSFINDVIKHEGYMELVKKDLDNDFFNLLDNLIKKGFIFTREIERNKEEIIQVHIPKDTLKIIKNLFNTYNTKKILDLRNLLGGIAYSYGVITKTQARKIVSIVKSDYLNYFDEFADIINYNGNTKYCMMFTNIVEDELLSIENLGVHFIQQLLEKEGEYKIYTYNDYIELTNLTYERRTSAYKKLRKYVQENFTNYNEFLDIEDLIDSYHFERQKNELTARFDLNKNIKDHFTVKDPNENLIYCKLINMIIDVSDQMPQWDLKGNIKEKNIPKEEKEERKIGRNELCPCGSGKKYKKCCGRNA